jgi:hypothetical protein
MFNFKQTAWCFGLPGGFTSFFFKYGGGDFFSDINQSDFFTDTDAGDDYPEKDVQSVEPSRSRLSDFDPFAGQASTDTIFDETKPFTDLDINKRWEIIKEAVFNLMDHHIPNLVEKKLVLLGDKATFAEYIEKIGETRELGVGARAPAEIRKSHFGRHYILWILDINQLIPRLKGGQGTHTQMDQERTLWHESMHIFELEHPELDAPFKKQHGGHHNFIERHAHYYDCLVYNLGHAEGQLDETGQLDGEALSLIKTHFGDAKGMYWGDLWSVEEQEKDLRAFYNKTGVYLSWSLFEGKFGSPPQKTKSYSIGVKSGENCWPGKFTNVNATSNVGIRPFTAPPMELEGRLETGVILKFKVYMTPTHYNDWRSEGYSPEDLCVMLF